MTKRSFLRFVIFITAAALVYGCASTSSDYIDWNSINYSKLFCSDGKDDGVACQISSGSDVETVGRGKR